MCVIPDIMEHSNRCDTLWALNLLDDEVLQNAFHLSICAKVCTSAVIVPLCKLKCTFGERTNTKAFHSNVDKEVL